MAWHFLADLPRWFRYARLLGVGPIRRVTLFPAVVALSAAAHGTEMAGMYSTLLAPRDAAVGGEELSDGRDGSPLRLGDRPGL